MRLGLVVPGLCLLMGGACVRYYYSEGADGTAEAAPPDTVREGRRDAADAPRRDAPTRDSPLCDAPTTVAEPAAKHDLLAGPELSTCAAWSSWVCVAGGKIDASLPNLACVASCGGASITCDQQKECACSGTPCGKFASAGCMLCSDAFHDGCCP
jgi:hypothetical protein